MLTVHIPLNIGAEARQFKGDAKCYFFPCRQAGDFIRQVSQLQPRSDILVGFTELLYKIVNRIAAYFRANAL
jgi:hypothetical protein